MKIYISFLLGECLTVLGVILSFHFISHRGIAALVASVFFILLSFFVIWGSYRWRPFFYKTMSFWFAIAFLLIFVLPMLWVRVASWGEPFATLEVWGIAAPVFHKYSSNGYKGLVLGTILDLLWWARNQLKI